MTMDLSTRYLGLTLKNPVIASASPLTATVDGIRRLEDCGAGAVVLPSLFEEQIRREAAIVERLVAVGSNSFPEVGSYFPVTAEAVSGPDQYLDLIARARQAVDIPVIASLNGTTSAGWVDHAGLIEDAGAAALELNIYRIAAAPDVTAPEVEAECLALVEAVRSRIKIPLAVKLHPHFSAFGAFARQLDVLGVDGLVLFNRVYQADIDLKRLAWTNDVALSTASDIRLGLLWISQLAGRLRHASLAGSTGVETASEVIKYLLVGADAVMTTGSLLRYGPDHLQKLLRGLAIWLGDRGITKVGDIKGLMMSIHPAADVEPAERDDYIRGLTGYRGPYVRY
jgi:dihydroorotate dehydrogenase (fumarate)